MPGHRVEKSDADHIEILEEHFGDLVLQSQKMWGFMRDRLFFLVKMIAAEDEISWILVPSRGQTPKMLDPTFPTMQLNCVFNETLPAQRIPSSFKLHIQR